jgi:hypothetical protein
MGTNTPHFVRSGWSIVAIVTALAALPAQGAGADAGAVTRSGPHFAIALRAGSLAPAVAGQLADAALAAAESAWPLCEKLLGARAGKPLTLHLHTEVGSFRPLAQAAGAGLRDAFAALEQNEAHVLLAPQLSPKVLEHVGLPEPTAHELVRHAALLVAAQTSPAVAADPWLGAVFAWGLLEELQNPEHLWGVDPAYDTRRQPLLRKLEARDPLTIKSTILDFEPPATRAAVEEDDGHQCLLARTMRATSKDWAKKLLTKPPKKLATRAEIRQAAVERAFGTDWIKTEALFTKLHQHAKPVWRVSAPLVAPRGGRLLCAGAPDGSAQFHAIAPPPAGPYTIRGAFEIHPVADDSFRIQLDWDQKSMVGCFFGVGKWRIETWTAGNAAWEKVAEGKAPIRAGAKFEGAIEVGKNVRLLVDGQEVGTWDHGGRDMHGQWSAGVNDCVVWIDQLRIEPAAK